MNHSDSSFDSNRIQINYSQALIKERTLIRLRQHNANRMQQDPSDRQLDRICSKEILRDLNIILFKLIKYMLIQNSIQLYHLKSYSDYFPNKQQKGFYLIFIAKTYFYFDRDPLRLQSSNIKPIERVQQLNTIQQIQSALQDQAISITEKMYAKILVVLLNTARLFQKQNIQILLNLYELSQRRRIAFQPIYSQLLSCFKRPKNLRNQTLRNWLTPHQNNIISFSIIIIAIQLGYTIDTVQINNVIELTANHLKPSIQQFINVQSNTIVTLQRWKKDNQTQEFRFNQLLFVICRKNSQGLTMTVKFCLNILNGVFQQSKASQYNFSDHRSNANRQRISDFDPKVQLIIVFKMLYLIRPLLSLEQRTQIIELLQKNQYYFRMKAQYAEIFYMMRFATPLMGKACFNTIFRCRQQCITLIYLQEVDSQALYQEIKIQRGVQQFIEQTIEEADFTNVSIQNRFISYQWVKKSPFFLKKYLKKWLNAFKKLTLSKQVLSNVIKGLFYLRQFWQPQHHFSKLKNQQKQSIQLFVKDQLFEYLQKRIKNQHFTQQIISIAFCTLIFITRQEYYQSKRAFLVFQDFLITNFKQFRKIEGLYQYFLELLRLKILQIEQGKPGYNALLKILKQIALYDGVYSVPINIFKNQYKQVHDSIQSNGYFYIEKDLLFIAAVMYLTQDKVVLKDYLQLIVSKIQNDQNVKNKLAQASVNQRRRVLLWKYLTHLYRLSIRQQFETHEQITKDYQFYTLNLNLNESRQDLFKRKIFIRAIFLSHNPVQKQKQWMAFINTQINNTLNFEKKLEIFGNLNALHSIRLQQKIQYLEENEVQYRSDRYQSLRAKFYKKNTYKLAQNSPNKLEQQKNSSSIAKQYYLSGLMKDIKSTIQEYENRQFNKFLSIFRRDYNNQDAQQKGLQESMVQE